MFLIPARIRAGETSTRWIPSTLIALFAPLKPSRNPWSDRINARMESMWNWQLSILDYRDIHRLSDAEVRNILRVRDIWPEGPPSGSASRTSSQRFEAATT